MGSNVPATDEVMNEKIYAQLVQLEQRTGIARSRVQTALNY